MGIATQTKAARILAEAGALSSMAPKPQPLENYGPGYRRQIADVLFDIRKVRESKGEMRAEIMVNGPQGRLSWDLSLNLGSDRTRTAFARGLEARYPAFFFSWQATVDQVAEQIIEIYRDGDKILSLAVPPKHIDTPYLLRPLLLQDEMNMIFADGKSGKSYLALALAAGLTAEAQMPEPLHAENDARVLYLDWETNVETHRRRLRRIAMGMGIDPPEILYRKMRRKLADEVDHVWRLVSQYGITMLVIDSVGWAAGGDINEASSAIDTINAINQIPDTTKLLLTHISAESARSNGPVNPFGSRYWVNGPRMVWEMRRSANGVMGMFSRWNNEDNGVRDFGLSFHFEPEGGPITMYGADISQDADHIQRGELKDQIVYALGQLGASSVKDIAAFLGKSQDKVRVTLNRHRMDLFRRLGDDASASWSLA